MIFFSPGYCSILIHYLHPVQLTAVNVTLQLKVIEGDLDGALLRDSDHGVDCLTDLVVLWVVGGEHTTT